MVRRPAVAVRKRSGVSLPGTALYAAAILMAVAAFLQPVLAPTASRPGDAVFLALLVAVCLGALLFEAGESGSLGPRAIAILGVLTAINSALRFVEVAIPGPGGFSPVFALMVLAGYAYGARFGFLLGALTLGVSAVVTGGVGPWLSYQMLAAGAVGATAGFLPGAGSTASSRHSAAGRALVLALAIFGAGWGFLYGIAMTLWFFPFIDPGAVADPPTIARFATLYLATAGVWDLFRALGNFALIAAFGAPVLASLDRVGRRFAFETTSLGPLPVAAKARAPRAVAVDSDAAQGRGLQMPAPDPMGRAGWALWLAGVLLLASVTTNPLLLLACWLGAEAVRQSVHPRGPDLPIGRIGSGVIAFGTVYGAAMIHAGATVLVRIPTSWPLVGGPVTAEGAAAGLTSGATLALMLASFGAAARALGLRDVVRLAPRNLPVLRLAATVALAYLPAMREEAAGVRETQLLRGGPAQGPRVWTGLVVPLISGGLDRALHLAESLSARGLVPMKTAKSRHLTRVLLLAGILVAAGGWAWATAFGDAAGRNLAMAGVLAIGATLALGRDPGPTSWRPERGPWPGLLLAAGAWAPVALSRVEGVTLAYSPFPALTLPTMPVALALAASCIVLPAAAYRAVRGDAPATTSAGAQRFDATTPAETDLGAPSARLTGFGYRYPGASSPALSGIDAYLPAGGITVVTGPSGAGKSTFLRSLSGLVPHFTGGEVAGDVAVADRRPLVEGPGAMADVVAVVSGDPESCFVMSTVGDEVAYALEQRGLAPVEIRGRVARALEQVDLAGLAGRSLSSLSGGERQRVAIAAALAARPALLVLDEPTSQLDDIASAAVMDAVVAARAAGATVVLSEHRLARVLPRADWVIALVPGPDGTPPSVRGMPARQAMVESTGPLSNRAPALSGYGSRATGAAAVELTGVTFAYPAAPASTNPGPPLLSGVDLRVERGEIVALTGPSGAGKSTILRLIIGLLVPRAGRIAIDGVPTIGGGWPDIARRAAFVPQDPNRLLYSATVGEELALTRRNHGLPASQAAVEALLSELGIGHLADANPRDLSTGQRQRVALAAVCAPDQGLWLLDEPTRGLDTAAIDGLARVLAAAALRGRAVVVATHDSRLMPAAHRVLRLEEGRLVPIAVPDGAGPDAFGRPLVYPRLTLEDTV